MTLSPSNLASAALAKADAENKKEKEAHASAPLCSSIDTTVVRMVRGKPHTGYTLLDVGREGRVAPFAAAVGSRASGGVAARG